MDYPLLDFIEYLMPRRPLGCRAEFCSNCLCLGKHWIYDNPKTSWRRAVGSAQRDWARYQVCPVCRTVSPHESKQRYLDPVTTENLSIEALWSATDDESSQDKALQSIRRTIASSSSEQRVTQALTAFGFALQDAARERYRSIDKAIGTLAILSLIVLIGLFTRMPWALFLLLAAPPLLLVYRAWLIARFDRREFLPAIESFLLATGISEESLASFVARQPHRLPILSKKWRALRLGTARSKLSPLRSRSKLRAGVDFLPPASGR